QDLRENFSEDEDFQDEDDEYALGEGMHEPLYPYRVQEDGDSDNSVHRISITRRPGPKRKQKFAVSRDFKIEEPNPIEMTNLVLEYLVIEGYPDAARALAAEANVKLEEKDWIQIEKRVAIKNDILSGNIAEAIEKLDVLCPGMIENDASVRFDLHQQRFLELIKQDDVFTALEWSSEKLSNEELDDSQMVRLEHTCTLAAFNDPTECKYAELLEQGQRETVAETVNSAILKAQGKPTTPRVESMYKMKMYMQLNFPSPSDRGRAAEERVAEEINADIVNSTGSDIE
ncbi:hypothetical protein PFISCL1PPCAC_3, partial [Pristionchus fissidentatus]